MDEQNTPQPTVPSAEPIPPNTINPQQSVQPVSVPQSPQVVEPQSNPDQPVPQPIPGYVPQSSPMQSFAAPQQPKKKKTAFVIVVILLLILIAGGVFAYTIISGSKENTNTTDTSTSEQDTKPSAITDAQVADITASSMGRLIKADLDAYFHGGSTGSKQYAENNYYPSASNMEDVTWVRKNLSLPEDAQTGLSNGTYTYKAIGCDSTKTANKQNACSSFTITVKQSSGDDITISSS